MVAKIGIRGRWCSRKGAEPVFWFTETIHLAFEGLTMNVHRSVDEAKVHAIHRRLVLAKDILEDSDKLPGRLGITDDGSAILKHPRHDREALVIYLLLT